MQVLTEFGLGTALRSGSYTAAAERALRDALWKQSIRAAEVFGYTKEDMRLDVRVGVQAPDEVDTDALAAVFPYGTAEITVVKGGLDLPHPSGAGQGAVMANVSITVQFLDASQTGETGA